MTDNRLGVWRVFGADGKIFQVSNYYAALQMQSIGLTTIEDLDTKREQFYACNGHSSRGLIGIFERKSEGPDKFIRGTWEPHQMQDAKAAAATRNLRANLQKAPASVIQDACLRIAKAPEGNGGNMIANLTDRVGAEFGYQPNEDFRVGRNIGRDSNQRPFAVWERRHSLLDSSEKIHTTYATKSEAEALCKRFNENRTQENQMMLDALNRHTNHAFGGHQTKTLLLTESDVWPRQRSTVQFNGDAVANALDRADQLAAPSRDEMIEHAPFFPKRWGAEFHKAFAELRQSTRRAFGLTADAEPDQESAVEHAAMKLAGLVKTNVQLLELALEDALPNKTFISDIENITNNLKEVTESFYNQINATDKEPK